MNMKRELNLRDLGGVGDGLIPHGLFLRSGKLSILAPDKCAELCKRFNIKCVIDLRTSVEAAEFPDPLPDGVVYLQIPLLKDAAVGIVKTAYRAFMAQRGLIETAIQKYNINRYQGYCPDPL